MTRHPKSLGELARRISAWTTNVLVTLMLVVMALGFGREVLHWWHREPAPPAAVPSMSAEALDDPAAPHYLEFGNQGWSIRRQEFRGSAGKLSAALQAACRTAVVESNPRSQPPDRVEQDLLKRLASQQPVAEEPGQWRLYQWGEGRAVVIGTRAAGSGEQAGRLRSGSASKQRGGGANQSFESAPTATGQKTGGRSARTTLDETAYRVVLWGIAVPAAKEAWTLYLFQAVAATAGQGQPDVEIPLPPGGHRLASIGTASGGVIMAFATDEGDSAREFYDRWFAEHGWTVAAAWQAFASGWQARFERRSLLPVLAVDVRLGADPQGRWTGLVMKSELEGKKP